MKKIVLICFIFVCLIVIINNSFKETGKKYMQHEIVFGTDKEEVVDAILKFLDDEWTFLEYINLIWYSTGEENDKQIRDDYEKKHKKYLGTNINLNKANLSIPAYKDGINIYKNSDDFISKFSINTKLEFPIIEIYGEVNNDNKVNIRLIIDSENNVYLEYKSFFYRLKRL